MKNSIDKFTARQIEWILTHYLKYGIKSVSMDDVARGLGISKKTLYEIVSSKSELVSGIIDAYLVQQEDKMEGMKISAENPLHNVLLNFSDFSDILEELNPSTIYDLKKYYPELWQKIEDFRHSITVKLCKENLVSGIKAGLYKPDLSIDALTELFYRVNSSFFDLNEDKDSQSSPAQVLSEFIEMYLNHVVSQKGRKWLDNYYEIKKVNVA